MSLMMLLNPFWEMQLPPFPSQPPLSPYNSVSSDYSVPRCKACILSLWAAKATFGCKKKEAPGTLVAKRIHMTSLIKMHSMALAIAHTLSYPGIDIWRFVLCSQWFVYVSSGTRCPDNLPLLVLARVSTWKRSCFLSLSKLKTFTL